MTDIRLVDVSLRDGNQSIWGATGVTTRMVEGVAASLDRVGYRAVELMTSTMFATAVRFHQEDPWERVRAARDRMPNTRLGFLTTGKRFITFYRTPESIFRLAFELLVRNGVTRLWVIDPMHDMAAAKRMATMAREAGFEEIVGGICYTTSPVHTDAYFADRIAELDGHPDIDSVYLKDPAGLLTPDRVRTLVPALRSRLTTVPFDEIHSHCTTGLAPLTVLEAADLGMSTIHCALPPLANGNSHPAAERVVANLRARGHQVDVDTEAMAEASAYLQRQARIKRLPVGAPAEYDEDYYRHNIPGGVLATLARQLGELRRPELLPAVKEEAVRVREDLGWPIVVTPFAQYIVTQATLNVMAGQRYAQVADEIVDLLRGDFGPLPGPVDQDLLDKALATRRAQQPLPGDDDVTLDQLRDRFGRGLPDEDLLLRAVMPAEQVDAMVAARGRSTRDVVGRVLSMLEERPGVTSFAVARGDTRISVEREAAP